MAWPRSVRSAFTKQMIAEDAFRNLARAALDLWTPFALDAVLNPTIDAMTAAGDEIVPSPEAMMATRAYWYAVMDALYLEGAGALYSYEMVQALAALGITPPEPDPDAVEDRVYVADHPDLDENDARRTALSIVAQSLGLEPAALIAVAGTASVRPYQAAYLATVRNRMADIPETMFRELTRELDDALTKGEGVNVMRERVGRVLGIDETSRRAETIARTESAGAMTRAVIDAAVSTGVSDLEKTWVATMDSRTRRSHYRADGQRVPVKSKFRVGRANLDNPGDSSGPPSEVINCRCAVFILRADEADPGEAGRQSKSQAELDAEIQRRADNGETRDRDEPPTTGRVASAMKGNTAMPTYRTWSSVLAEVGVETDDGRMLAEDITLTFREFPLPLMWQKQSEPGHYSSYAVGVIETAERSGDQIVGTGYLLNTPEADEAASQIEHGVSRPSVDLGSAEWVLLDQDGNEIDLEAYWNDELPEGTRFIDTMTAAKVLGATLVSIPAFAGVSIKLTGDREIGGDQEAVVASIVASGERVFGDDFRPRREHFTNPKLTAPTPVTHDTATGRVFGHLALWGKAHIAVGEYAPKSPSGYRYFHTSPINTDQGAMMVGKLTVDTGHAGLKLGAGPAASHYDHTGTCWAYVVAGEDQFGIWVSGVLHPFADDAKVHDGLTSPLSGDWREIGGQYEMVAGLSVNVPGFPLVAGATRPDGGLLSLVAALGPRPSKDAAMSTVAELAKKKKTKYAVGDEGDGGEDDTSTDDADEPKYAVGSTVTVDGAKGTVSAAEATTGYEVTFEDDSTAWFVERDVEADEAPAEDDAAPPVAEAAVINVGQLAAEVTRQLAAIAKRDREAASIVARHRNREAAAIIAKVGR